MKFTLLQKLKTNKQNNIVQIIGLILAVVTCIFICRNAFFEYSFDKFHQYGNMIYRTQNTEGMLLGPMAKENLSYVEDYTRLHPCYRGVSVESEENIFYEPKVYFADGALFKIFTFPVKEGDAFNSLNTINQVVISERYAKKYFGEKNPIGETLLLNGAYENKVSYTVGAVFKDIPSNSHMKFDMLLSMENIMLHRMYAEDSPWQWGNFFTYFKTYHAIDKESFSRDLSVITHDHGAPLKNGKRATYSLFTLNELHLNGQTSFMENNQKAQDVNIRILMALIIMCIAWLNYINIGVGSALKNKLALGMKKVMGASSINLWFELFKKNLIINGIAFVISVALFLALKPIIEKAGGKPYSLSFFNQIVFWLSIICIQVIGSLLVSFSIHKMMSRQKLIGILSKGASSMKGKQSPWIGLFVLQFSTSIVLIGFALFSTKQINEIMSVNTGIQTHQILAIRSADASEDPEISKVRAVFENEVLRIPGVIISSSASYIPGGRIASYMPTRLSVKTEDDNINCRMNFVGYDYIPLFRHKIEAGRNFSEDYGSDNDAVIINKTLARAYGFVNPEDALGKEIFWETRNSYRTIIGVMDDFHQQSADVPIEPTMFQLWDHARGYCLLNIVSTDTKAKIKEIEMLWNKVHKGNAFDYFWIDEHYNKQFEKWIQYSKMIKAFSLIAILIACVGLFGLSSMLLGKRTKEIGVRKINGANEMELISLLNKDFIKWVVVAFLIACPISLFAFNKWLENFAYKTELSWWIFALAGTIALLIALLTISLQTFKVVRTNPVEALRYE